MLSLVVSFFCIHWSGRRTSSGWGLPINVSFNFLSNSSLFDAF